MNQDQTPIFILDLDGTLMPSHEVDNRCYWQAVDEVFRTQTGTLDLHEFENVTDNGILAEWCDRTLGRPASDSERQAVRTRFLELLRAAARQQPSAFSPFAGARRWLDQQPGGSVAVATGGWEHTARFKLKRALLDGYALPLSSADQGTSRTAIMRHALNRLCSQTSNEPDTPMQKPLPADVTYLGDGPWDLAAATALGWKFIGIAQRQRAMALQKAGADPVFGNFLPLLG